ncbi:MAG: hypothetical protein LLG44_06645 [Chloroflexi bacterium]|nr:hypothetical protein [Chloroflexota bacterium]
MGYMPSALTDLLERFRRDQRTFSAETEGTGRLCREFIEPLLELLGWDVHNQHDAPPGKEPVEQFTFPLFSRAQPLYAYLLHEQAFHYYRHHLLGVCTPPIGRCAPDLLAAIDDRLSHSAVLIETLALTDFASLRFYDNTPTAPHRAPGRRALLYTLPCSQYAAWWDALTFPAGLFHDRRKFALYAYKLRLWGGLPTGSAADDETI